MSSQAIETVMRIVHDAIRPLEQRVQVLERTLDSDEAEIIQLRKVMAEPAVITSGPSENETALQERLKRIEEIHRLDAEPAQYVYQGGKMVAAPEGTWEVYCVVCTDHKYTFTQEPGKKPTPCMTVRVARGEA